MKKEAPYEIRMERGENKIKKKPTMKGKGEEKKIFNLLNI